jgi:hypothetical protein
MAGTWQGLTNQPAFAASTMLLLTDGTVMCQEEGGKNWHRLTPDTNGDYVQGTWSTLAPMKNTREYYGSAVLADGRVFVAGGEFSDAGKDTNAAEIYDPTMDTWISLPTFDLPGWNQSLGDVPLCMLADGRILLGSIVSNQTAFYDPATNNWSPAGPKEAPNCNEETWTLLPDGSVLTVECQNVPKAERYVPSLKQWVSAGSTPVVLVEAGSIEIGPALLLPDGRVFCVGATGSTALYTAPAVASQPDPWSTGPPFPQQGGQQLIAKDAPGCLLPNGRVLCAVGPVAGCAADFQGYCPPTYFFEFDPVASSLTPIATPANAAGPPYSSRMLLLPTGQVLLSAGSTNVQVYTPDGAPQPAWQPTITQCRTNLILGHTYTLTGQQLNGLSQAVSYGDDATMATNYPLVRVLSHTTGKTWYCRTAGHSSMAVATGTALQTTRFTVPAQADTGPADLVVVANGIASAAVAVVLMADVATRISSVEIDATVFPDRYRGLVELDANAPPGTVITLEAIGPDARFVTIGSHRLIINEGQSGARFTLDVNDNSPVSTPNVEVQATWTGHNSVTSNRLPPEH